MTTGSGACVVCTGGSVVSIGSVIELVDVTGLAVVVVTTGVILSFLVSADGELRAATQLANRIIPAEPTNIYLARRLITRLLNLLRSLAQYV
jgi:hypothetical protein